MSYPKDPYYEKTTVGNSTYYSSTQQMSTPAPGQCLPPAYPGAPPAYPSAPPPYSATLTTVPGGTIYQSSQYAYSTGVPPQPQVQPYPSNPAPPPPYTNYGQPAYNQGYPVQHGFNYSAQSMAVAQFDSGARFDGIATHHIPPPPPGCVPNAAQLAAAQGGTVVASQKKAGWFSGTGGGVSFW